MNNKQQTAVEWLLNAIETKNGKEFSSYYTEFIEKAKEMEKKQHSNTWLDSRIETMGDDFIGKEKTFDEFYNETYGGNK
jgi:hypothetical protein